MHTAQSAEFKGIRPGQDRRKSILVVNLRLDLDSTSFQVNALDHS